MKYTHYSVGKALYDFYSLVNKYQKPNEWAQQTSERSKRVSAANEWVK